MLATAATASATFYVVWGFGISGDEFLDVSLWVLLIYLLIGIEMWWEKTDEWRRRMNMDEDENGN